MKLLFKNTTTLSAQAYIELLKFHNKKYSLSYFLYTAFFSILLIIFVIFLLIHKKTIPALCSFIIVYLFITYRLLFPIFKSKKELKNNKIKNNSINTYSFYLKHFEVSNNYQGLSKIKYSKLYKVFENEQFFYLYYNKDLVFIVDKNSFVIGNSEDFGKFINRQI